MFNKNFLVVCLCIFSLKLNAQIPNGYYNSTNGLSGVALQQALHDIIDNHTVISYGNLYNAFGSTDQKTNGKVWDIYSDLPGGTPPYEYSNTSADQCGNYDSEADCYNREHSWPNSWFGGLSNIPTYSDLFHLYPTDGYVNNRRANNPYGEVTSATWTSENGSKVGSNTTTGYSGTVFEPIDEYKGDLARGYFYLTTRYKGEDSNWDVSEMTNKATLLPWAVCLLLDWHHQDSVSTKETNRNNSIYQLQNNRNPFIDHPEWADSIFSCTLNPTGVEERRAMNKLSVYPNPANDAVNVSGFNSGDNIQLCNFTGQVLSNFSHTRNSLSISVENLPSGIYWLKGNKEGVKFIVSR